ncbi:uncharacterized protein AC631_00993 [Debaryomyces fabryi]|uniref:Zn(2)-C6 fungal-type domain-containing protein n=1 Tax=Debaryomyces fabryi TaxID=58627 RepID=A0A0V1Q427_9ASCO|nr:uncharacterized protein AC631_00993 [Debaryomyces fabryi]KSA03219.1 hypothetical protein AC631_00993 [Debaryomyces fabryi]CUM55238.1 unnamed protein product [Debaryomyces fabryi]
MEKSRIKSILPKPSAGVAGGSPVSSTNSGGNKRRSLPSNNATVVKKQKSLSLSEASISGQSGDKGSKQTGHRPVTSCTFCRQHKIKCNASENYPNPCHRCDKMGLKCEIDPQFRPKKGSQIQSLKSDVDELKAKIEMLTKNESLLTQALNQHNMNFTQQQLQPVFGSITQNQMYNTTPIQRSVGTVSDFSSGNTPSQFQSDNSPSFASSFPHVNTSANLSPSNHLQGNQILNDAIPTSASLGHILHEASTDNSPTVEKKYENSGKLVKDDEEFETVHEFVLGDVSVPLNKANELHDRFITKHLPFLPIITSNSATELYHKSKLLFWSVILTAALSEPEPTLYMSLASLIKHLAIETCWTHTPRSTHVIQALVILSIWPLPNEKVLDDCSYRFIGLAKNLSLQLGLHRGGEFIQEFSRTQASLGPDAELWRTRTWLAVFFCEQFWSSVLGLPPLINTTDYLLENARVDQSLPTNFRCLISLSIFQCKLVNVMGISVTRPDGLLEPLNRAGSLNTLDRELERLKFKLPIENGSSIEIYYLYIKLMICCFAFLPGTPIEDQVKYVSAAYHSATRIITLTSQMISSNTILLIEFPIYVRQAITYSVLMLFKLHLSRYLIDKYVDSSRQLIVTVHRLFRNTLSSWKELQNDISRTAKVLENLNIVLYTYPEIFLSENNEIGGSIITRMRSHLTASLFYDLVWCIHEARRRTVADKSNPPQDKKIKQESNEDTVFSNQRKPIPLPFYNQITKDDFKTITTTTPNGTTVTTLVPTDHALTQAKLNANANGLDKPLEINGIPLAMLEATGSMRDVGSRNANQENAANSLSTPFSNDSINKSNPLSTASRNQYHPQIEQMARGQPMLFSPGDPLGEVHSMGTPNQSNFQYVSGTQPGFNGVADQMDDFFQKQSDGWINNDNYQDDDFLGWFDANMIPEN